MSDVSIAVLGCGRIGAMHAGLLSDRIEGARVCVVYDVMPEAAQAVAGATGARLASSIEDAVRADDVDAVAICTSTDTHVDAIVAAAVAGKPIFCEKPLSLDLAEVDRALAAVDAAGVGLQVGFNRRFDPSHRAVAEAVAAGAVGDVHLCRITSRDPEPPPLSYIAVSGGLYCDMTIHDFDMARFVTGSEVVEVFATGAVRVDSAIGEAGDVDTAVVVLTHEDGTITTIDNSRRASYGYDQRVEVFGSGGMAASGNHHEFSGVVATERGFTRPPLQHFFIERYTQSYLDEWAAFVEMVSTGGPSPVAGHDGRAPLIMGLAAWTSLREGRPVRTEEIG